MLNNLNKESILFLDVETVPQYTTYDRIPNGMKLLWDHKAERIRKNENETPEILYERAGIYAEFGKIVCISVGFFAGNKFRIKSFADSDEKPLLVAFTTMLEKASEGQYRILCAHNGKEFDFPYIARRLLINRIKLPPMLDHSGKKPWEVPHLDTMELWRFGDYKSYTSLELLAFVFGLPTPKDDMRGSEVGKVFWNDNDLDRIKQYCEKDVATVARLFLCYKGEPVFGEDALEIV